MRRFVEEYVSRMKETHFVAVHEFMFLAMLLSDVTLGIFGLERTLLCFRAKRNYNKKSARNCKAPILMFYRGTFLLCTFASKAVQFSKRSAFDTFRARRN